MGQPLQVQVQHTGVFSGAQPIFTGANPVVPNPANAGGAPQYPQAVRQQSVPQMGANPFAACRF